MIDSEASLVHLCLYQDSAGTLSFYRGSVDHLYFDVAVVVSQLGHTFDSTEGFTRTSLVLL